MYIKPTKTYYKSTEQCTSRASFLLLIQPKSYARRDESIKAIVRKVALRQLGHWMMGTVRIYNHSITVSGSYGADGLICDVPDEVYDRAQVILPTELVEAWSNGGGWNSCGTEAKAMREWALENLERLQR